MSDAAITSGQMKRLQIVYGQYERRSLDAGGGREGRLAWASQQVGRSVASFRDLTSAEARKLIDGLQAELGVKAPVKSRQRLDRRSAQNAGTAGRRDQGNQEATFAAPEDLARIQHVLGLLGWTEESLQRFLAAASSPLRGRKEIRTLSDANRVWWALKRIAQAKGVWIDRKEFNARRRCA